ncbi:MAG: hypothetical protein AAFP86_20185, partial [Planctomycetota bacterium]
PLGANGKRGPVRGYASGGIARSPQLAVFGEKPGVAEAFVPLPDGKSIPVTFQGTPAAAQGIAAGVSNMDVRVGLTVNALDPRGAAEAILEQRGLITDMVTEAIQTGSDRALQVTVDRGRGGRR